MESWCNASLTGETDLQASGYSDDGVSEDSFPEKNTRCPSEEPGRKAKK